MNPNYKSLKEQAENKLQIAMLKYSKIIKAKALSSSIKRGIKAANERKVIKREVKNNG